MQSRDENNNIVFGGSVNKENLEKMMQKAEERGAVSHTFARLPASGKHFMLGSLEFVVKYVDHKRGKLHASLVTGENELEVNNHVFAVALTEHVIQDNNFIDNWEDAGHMHTSYVSEQELEPFRLPQGKVVRVTVELVDKEEMNAT